MAAPPCKGVKKDGTPCRGNGNEQLDGYCIAHGAPEKTRAWRVLGGENSSTAARADKRIPERFRPVIQAVTNGIAEVREGTLKPAAYAAICRGAKILLELYRAADADMELVRLEEIEAAAAEVSGSHGDLEILDAAAELSAQQERYRLESLADQGLLSIEPAPPPANGKTKPSAQPVLTDVRPPPLRLPATEPAPPRTTSNSSKTRCPLCNVYNEYPLRDMLQSARCNANRPASGQCTELDHPPEPARDALTGLALSQLPSPASNPAPRPRRPWTQPRTPPPSSKTSCARSTRSWTSLKDTYTGRIRRAGPFKYHIASPGAAHYSPPG